MLGGLVTGLTFGVPYLLWALAGLPVIYWLLRVTPPAPKRIVFPPLRLLFGLKASEETPARTPLWLLLLRLLAAAIAIFALAEPLYDPTPVAEGNGPVVLVVDNGWPSAAQWETRQAAMNRALTGANRDGRPILIAATAELAPVTSQFLDPGAALKTIADMVPRPWLPDRAKTLAQLREMRFESQPQILWLSDGLDHGDAKAFADGLEQLGSLGVFQDGPTETPLAMRPPDNVNSGFGITLHRLAVDVQKDGRVAALDARGQILETAPYHFGLGAREATTTIALPLELRNDTVRIAVMGNESAGAVQLIDARFRRRPVGLVSGGAADSAQPLLSDVYYIERALSPYAELHKGTVEQVLDSGIAVIAIADIGRLSAVEHERIVKFVEEGGVLLRFGGPRLAAQSDDLVPVRLRSGERLMGSSMTWASPQRLTPFTDDSPFRGLNIANDVTVTRQVLAEPSVELADHTWARLTDGTPLVTGTARGRGWIVLFHVSASPGWSSLPISGLYVDMLRRVVELSEGMQGGAAAAKTGTFPPFQSLDGFGNLEKPYPEATPLRASEIETVTVSPLHPPGFYGVQGGLIARC
jgi:Aerotolerance regulator N-terminal